MTQSRRATQIDRLVAANIRRLRLQAGLSQETLSAAIGTSFQQVQKYERAANRISIGRLVLICEALAVSVSELLAAKK